MVAYVAAGYLIGLAGRKIRTGGGRTRAERARGRENRLLVFHLFFKCELCDVLEIRDWLKMTQLTYESAKNDSADVMRKLLAFEKLPPGSYDTWKTYLEIFVAKKLYKIHHLNKFYQFVRYR